MKPVHPTLVHFPIALLFLSVAADLVGFFSNSASLRNTGWWALIGAALGGVVTVAAGVYDMRRATLEEEVHRLVHQHMKVGFALLASIIGLTVWRWTIYTQPELSVSAMYLDVAVLTMGLAGFQGWLGGELVYSHGVFVKRAAPRARPEANPQRAQSHQHH
jgi:uncharacterized membrane protein